MLNQLSRIVYILKAATRVIAGDRTQAFNFVRSAISQEPFVLYQGSFSEFPPHGPVVGASISDLSVVNLSVNQSDSSTITFQVWLYDGEDWFKSAEPRTVVGSKALEPFYSEGWQRIFTQVTSISSVATIKLFPYNGD